jgi:hypothetical protein
VQPFVSQYHIPYPVALAHADFLPAASVEALPTTLLIDKQGRLAKLYAGAASERALRADIDALLRETE